MLEKRAFVGKDRSPGAPIRLTLCPGRDAPARPVTTNAGEDVRDRPRERHDADVKCTRERGQTRSPGGLATSGYSLGSRGAPLARLEPRGRAATRR